MSNKELIEYLKTLTIPDEKFNPIFVEKVEKILDQQNKISEEYIHDFKNLISSLKSALEGLSMVEFETVKMYLQKLIIQSVLEIIENIENLLVKYNFQNNNNIEIVNLSEIIQSILNEVYPLILEKNLEIITKLNDVTIKANPFEIKRILSNLLLNAIKYNKPHGKIEVFVKENSDRIQIIIKDTGVGISPEIKQKIFKEKIREYNNIPGSGMGLLIVKKLLINLVEQ